MKLPVYTQARAALFHHADANIVGVYMGWHGRSLPSFLDYLTFWDRKGAAQRVGTGDVVELLSRLNAIWNDANSGGHYTGLVTIGHSFGGHVTLSAVSSILRNRIVAATPQPGPAEVISGFGDLVVLVNPAAEAALFDAISIQTRDVAYGPNKHPCCSSCRRKPMCRMARGSPSAAASASPTKSITQTNTSRTTEPSGGTSHTRRTVSLGKADTTAPA